MSSGLGGFLFGNIDEEGKLDNEDFDEELRANLTTFSEKIQDKKILLEGGFLTEDLIEEISGSIENSKGPQNKNVLPLPEAENFEDINELAEQPINEKLHVKELEPVQQENIGIGLIEPLTTNSTLNNDFDSFIQFDTRQILKFTRLSAKPSLLNATGRSYSRYATLRKLRLKRKQLHCKSASFSSAENQIDAFLNKTGPSSNVPSAASARLRLSLINLSAGATGPITIPTKIKKPWHQSTRFHDLEKSILKTKNILHHEESSERLISLNPSFHVKLPENSHFHPISLLEWENEIIWDNENIQRAENIKGMYVNLSVSTTINNQVTTGNAIGSNAQGGGSGAQQSSNLGGASLSSILSSLSLSNGALGGDSVTSSATATALLALIRNQQMRSASISTSSLASSRPSMMGPPGHLTRSTSTTLGVNPSVNLKFPKAPAARILNREFEHGDWSDSIIWDVEGADIFKLNTHLILPLDDPELIFTALPVENLSKKLGRAEKLIAKRLKKLQTSTSAITSFAKPIMDKFNLSNDKYYESAHGIDNDNNSTNNSKQKSVQDQTASGSKTISCRSSVSATFLGLHHSVPALQHSVPALKLSPPAFQTCRTKRDLRLLHRPRFSIPPNFTISTWLKVKSPAAVKKTGNSQKITEISGNLRLTLSCNPSGGIIRSAKKLTLKDSCRFVLLEYFEEFPPLLMNPGMGAYIVLYYRKKSPQDTFVPRSTFALVQVLDFTDPSPFMMFGDVPAGCSRYALCNGLFRAPMIQHKSPNSDFIISRHCDIQSTDDFHHLPEPEFYLRPLESAPVMLVGQEFPLVEVPGPHSRRHNMFCRQRLQVAAYRLFNKDPLLPESGHSRKRLKIGRLLTAFPQFSEGSIRKWLKEFAESTRAGKDSGVWLLKEDAPQLDEDELRALVTPEAICQYESMMAEQQRLSDAELIFYDPFNSQQFEEDVEEASGEADENTRNRTTKIRSKELEELTTAAPWNTTANFLSAVQGRCTLKLRGIGDPSGRSEAFSFVKAPGEKGTSSSVANSVGSEYRQDISRIWESHINSISQGSSSNNNNVTNNSQNIVNIPLKLPSLPDGCKLVISRKFGADQWINEEITDPLIIRAYLRVRQQGSTSSAAEKKLRRGFIAPDALPTLSASDAAPLSIVKSKKKPVSKVTGTGKKSSTGSQITGTASSATIEKNLQIKCGACGQVGHMRTNRICPMFSDVGGSSNCNNNNTFSSMITTSSTTTTTGAVPELKLKLKLSSTGTNSISSNESIYPSPVLLPVSHRPKGPEIEPLQRKRPRRKLTAKQLHSQFLANQSVEVKSKLAALSSILISIVDGIILLPTTPAFHKPVPRKLYPLYYKLISNPIDLSSIRSKAVTLSYTNSQEFIEDFNLLLSNCITFNGQESALSDVARDMLSRVKISIDSEEIKEIDTFLKGNINTNMKKESTVQIDIDQGDDVSIMTDQEEAEDITSVADVTSVTDAKEDNNRVTNFTM